MADAGFRDRVEDIKQLEVRNDKGQMVRRLRLQLCS